MHAAHWIERQEERCPEWTVTCEHGQTTSEEMADRLGKLRLRFWYGIGEGLLKPYISGDEESWSLLLILVLMSKQHIEDFGCQCAAQTPEVWLAA
jgi:hypothetical protein